MLGAVLREVEGGVFKDGEQIAKTLDAQSSNVGRIVAKPHLGGLITNIFGSDLQ